MSIKKKKKLFFDKYFSFNEWHENFDFLYEYPFKVFSGEVTYLRQYFFTSFFFFYIGSPWLALIYMLINAALWLGYEDDMDEEDVFDDDMEGDDDFIWEEANYAYSIDLFMGLPESEDESIREDSLDIALHEYNIEDDQIIANKFIEVFNSTKHIDSFSVSFFYDLYEWDDFLLNTFGESFLNLTSHEFENAVILEKKFYEKKFYDNLNFPIKDPSKTIDISVYYQREITFYSKNIEAFFFALYYKFSILRNQLDARYVYDIIMSDLNDFFFYDLKGFDINKTFKCEDIFFKNFQIFKKKLEQKQFFFVFDTNSNKFVYDYTSVTKFNWENTRFLKQQKSLSILKLKKKNKIAQYLLYKSKINRMRMSKKKKIKIFFNSLFFRSKIDKLLKNKKIKPMLNQMKRSLIKQNKIIKKIKLDLKNKNYIKTQERLAKLFPKRRKSTTEKVKENVKKNFKKFQMKIARNRTRYTKYKNEEPISDFFKMRKKSFFWDNFYTIIDSIFLDPIIEHTREYFQGVPGLGLMNDHLISVVNRKMPLNTVESIFVQKLLKYKPVFQQIESFDTVDPMYYDLVPNRKFKKIIENNLDAFIKNCYKDFVLSDLCTYEQLWFSLGFYYPLINDIISHKLFFLLKKYKNKKK